jgi:predicted RNA-binding Zn-ribbon protein involved in translation (DUF1610 family)
MCNECIDLDKKISRYLVFMKGALDPMTTERLNTAVAEMTERKISLHVNRRPLCPKCAMSMIASAEQRGDPAILTYECLRCGHVGVVDTA